MNFTNDFVLEAINREFPDTVIHSETPYDFLTIEIKKKDLKKVIQHLKESSLNFSFLTDICGIHYPENKEKELGVIYHLHNLEKNFRLRIKVFFERENAEVESICDLFSGANWMERETFDFYGIKFANHPDLRVILNDEELGYHPMLKEYSMEENTRTDKDDSMFGR